ncbi:MAG: hypothetical protein ACLFS3_03085, partial [Candidatus Aenigmatarchaeota archaeon]
REAGNDTNRLEEKARQASNHMAHLANLSERVPEPARQGIQRAMENGARSRERSVEGINRTDPERARNVAEATLEEVMANAPEQARKGLETALDNVRRERGGKRIGPPANASERGPEGRMPEEGPNGEGAENGQPENATEGMEEGETENVTNGQEQQPPV